MEKRYVVSISTHKGNTTLRVRDRERNSTLIYPMYANIQPTLAGDLEHYPRYVTQDISAALDLHYNGERTESE